MKKNGSETSYQAFNVSSYLDGNSAAYVERLYEDYLLDPSLVPVQWQAYFSKLNAGADTQDQSHATVRECFAQLARLPATSAAASVSNKQYAVDSLIAAFRHYGHLSASINPLDAPSRDPRLSLQGHELSEADLSTEFLTRRVLPENQASLERIFATLQANYCGYVGYEFEHIDVAAEREWLIDYIERRLPEIEFDVEQKTHLLERLTAAEGLEKFLDVKYPGQKRFSNEGMDSLIAVLDQINQQVTRHGVKELKIGMAHRGRINVLINTMGQSAQELFQEFDGTKDYGLTTGDVKYHRGFSSDIETSAGPLHLTLTFNPSHLEFINPVVLGSVRARQDRSGSANQADYALAVLIHGDSAFSGQGIVMETLSMAHTRPYSIGGSLHVILNNQIGFTTNDPSDTRSSRYCSDLGKMIAVPIFHINADAPEMALKIVQMAVEYRMKFHKDVILDLIGFRRHGHQEVDEPRATQPMMYKNIAAHPGVRTLYANRMIEAGLIDQAAVEKMWVNYRDLLDAGQKTIQTLSHGLSEHYATNWTPYIDRQWALAVDTSVDKEKLTQLATKMETLPEGFELQRNVGMIMQARAKMTQGELPIDWGYGETMAYATLLDEGYAVRLVGEDSQRGTFFHRHSVLHDQNTGEQYMPLEHLGESQARINVYNSLLSEAGALGFEYGYTIAEPDTLTLWEAQFGDFANGAQVIIDQFISSGWQKWNRLSGLVMLLPHGYEGMGPEHSSARLERYMQLCAQDNMQICVPSTPSQIFHLLRRQMIRPFRKPLIVLSPKSLLRHKLAVSSLDDLATGHFNSVIGESDQIDPGTVRRVIVCSGKVYYDLLQKRRDNNIQDIAIVRVEQLYPFPYEDLSHMLQDYVHAQELVWVQEEPKNQGAWFVTRGRLVESKLDKMQLFYSCRPASAAPAAGYPALFKKLQAELIDRALSLNGLDPFADAQ